MLVLRLAVWSLPLGAILDAWLRDPHGWPHPVRAIGALIACLESALRRLCERLGSGPRAERLAGVVLAITVVGATALCAWGWIAVWDRTGPIGSLIGRALLVYWGL